MSRDGYKNRKDTSRSPHGKRKSTPTEDFEDAREEPPLEVGASDSADAGLVAKHDPSNKEAIEEGVQKPENSPVPPEVPDREEENKARREEVITIVDLLNLGPQRPVGGGSGGRVLHPKYPSEDLTCR